jgi:hypothetical protein
VWLNRIRQVFNETDRPYFKKDRERAPNEFPNSWLTPEQQKKSRKSRSSLVPIIRERSGPEFSFKGRPSTFFA